MYASVWEKLEYRQLITQIQRQMAKNQEASLFIIIIMVLNVSKTAGVKNASLEKFFVDLNTGINRKRAVSATTPFNSRSPRLNRMVSIMEPVPRNTTITIAPMFAIL